MSKRRNQHVVPASEGWAVKSSGAQKATKVYPTQQEAVAAARKIAVNQKAELIIHGKDGKIRAKNTYGRDPYPPKDRSLTPPEAAPWDGSKPSK